MIEGISFSKHPRDGKTGMFVRKLKTPEQVREVCEDYFQGLVTMGEEVSTDKDGNTTTKQIVVQENIAGIAGLAAHLGIHRSYLFEYVHSGKDDLAPIQHILRAAIATIEAEQEQRLFKRDTSRGAEFSLRCNFKWGEDGHVAKEIVEAEVEGPDEDATAIPKWEAPTPAPQALAHRRDDVFADRDG